MTSGQTVAVKPKQIRLVHQVDSKKWQAHYKFENLKMWFRRCTDTANVKEAIKIAERLWMKAAFDFDEGSPVISRNFKPMAYAVLARMSAVIAAGTAKPCTPAPTSMPGCWRCQAHWHCTNRLACGPKRCDCDICGLTGLAAYAAGDLDA